MRQFLPAWTRRRLDPAQRYGLRLTLFALAILLVALPFSFLLTQVLVEGPVVRFDSAAALEFPDLIRDHVWLVSAMHTISFLGKPIFLFVVIAPAVLYLLSKGLLRLAVFLTVTPLLGGAIDTVVKVAVDRERPRMDDPLASAMGKSFPSGHSMSSLVAYGALLLVFLPVLSRRARGWAAVAATMLVLAIGGSRLFLGVHFISDVIGGFVLGAAWLTAATAAFSIWRVERGEAPVDVHEGLAPEAAEEMA